MLKGERLNVSDEQRTCACIGFTAYFEKQDPHVKEDLKTEYLPILRKIGKEKPGTILGDKAVYSMIYMRDYEVIRELLFDENLDYELKVSAIDTCYGTLIDEIEKNTSLDRIDAVIKSLEIHPVIDVAEALEKAIEDGRYIKDEAIMLLIEQSKDKGVRVVNKDGPL